MAQKKVNYLRRLIDENDPASVKRFTVLAVLMHYIITCFAALFMNKSIANTALVTTIMEYNFFIILVGIFGLTVESVAAVMLKKAEVLAASAPSTVVQQAQNVLTTNTTNTDAQTVNTENIETVNTENTNVTQEK